MAGAVGPAGNRLPTAGVPWYDDGVMRYPSNHLAVVVVGFLALVGATAPAQPILDGAEVVTFREVGGVELRLHGYKPKDWKASDRRPAIVLFFGGGWVGGTPKQFQPHAKYLASRGMVAFCASVGGWGPV